MPGLWVRFINLNNCGCETMVYLISGTQDEKKKSGKKYLKPSSNNVKVQRLKIYKMEVMSMFPSKKKKKQTKTIIKVPRDQSVKKQNTKQDATVKGNQGLGEIISHYYKQNNRYYQ